MKTLNGQSLKTILISGSNNLYNHYPEVDALNVFPVPDGDTGMNMNLTLTSGSKEISNRSDESAYEIAKVLYDRAYRKGFEAGKLEGKKEGRVKVKTVYETADPNEKLPGYYGDFLG